LEDNKYDFVILTTACSRSELHSKVLSDIPKFLFGYKCKWIIRVDELIESIDVTIKNLQQILQDDHIDLEIKSSNRKAGRISWFKSVQWCINEGIKYTPKYGYFWLEDDWKLNSQLSLKEMFSPPENNYNYYISLANRNDLNFNPCIWSIDLYKVYMHNKINTSTMPEDGGNAERTCVFIGDEMGKNLSPEPTTNIQMKKMNLFYDVGRDWANNNINGKRTFN